uniref:Cytoplasmic 60S subunit biogenesis factor REI1 homolog 2-like n=1 Tax=Diabrotica virgifera virgifera TaxID=50390 RepID=A0A6P7GEV8_DIAVI
MGVEREWITLSDNSLGSMEFSANRSRAIISLSEKICAIKSGRIQEIEIRSSYSFSSEICDSDEAQKIFTNDKLPVALIQVSKNIEIIPTNKPTIDVEDEDMETEEVDSDEWDDVSENPIDNNDCLFCSHHSGNFYKNLDHMTIVHSFFIPDIEYCSDLQGLLRYLGDKISE